MAASISHNLKNPLGSIKTILQVQMENPELPESIRGETKMVLEEIAAAVGEAESVAAIQPASGSGRKSSRRVATLELLAEEVGGVLRHEAERRGVVLEVELAGG